MKKRKYRVVVKAFYDVEAIDELSAQMAAMAVAGGITAAGYTLGQAIKIRGSVVKPLKSENVLTEETLTKEQIIEKYGKSGESDGRT